MDNTYNTNETQTSCCRNYCTNVIENEEAKLENHYKCGQQPLTASEVWRIQRNRRPAAIRNNYL